MNSNSEFGSTYHRSALLTLGQLPFEQVIKCYLFYIIALQINSIKNFIIRVRNLVYAGLGHILFSMSTAICPVSHRLTTLRSTSTSTSAYNASYLHRLIASHLALIYASVYNRSVIPIAGSICRSGYRPSTPTKIGYNLTAVAFHGAPGLFCVVRSAKSHSYLIYFIPIDFLCCTFEIKLGVYLTCKT